jgi:hypothetical protein
MVRLIPELMEGATRLRSMLEMQTGKLGRNFLNDTLVRQADQKKSAHSAGALR